MLCLPRSFFFLSSPPPPPSILSSVNGPQRVKNANPKSKLSAVALHVATWQPLSPPPHPAAPPRTHIRHAYMSDGRWRRVAQKKRKNKKCYAGMEFENVCPGIMQRAPAEEPVGPVSCAPREGSGRGRRERKAVWGKWGR